MRMQLADAQQALGFLVEQTSYIEPEVYQIVYPDIQYPALIPVDTNAPEWAKSITFFSTDKVGEADWYHHMATDMRLADVERTKFEQGIEMAAIGYRYSLEEINQSMMTGTNLTTERADSSRYAYEVFVDKVAFTGDTRKGWTGLVNDANVTRVDAANDGASSSRLWSAKTDAQIIRDINDALTGIWTGASGVEMADTILLPLEALSLISSKTLSNTSMTVLNYIRTNNVYTMQTGQPLTIRAVLGLENAGSSSVGRMVAYRRDPRVLKLHIPMPHRFLPVWQRTPLVFDVPGIFRLGGVEIRRPSAVRYVDGISP